MNGWIPGNLSALIASNVKSGNDRHRRADRLDCLVLLLAVKTCSTSGGVNSPSNTNFYLLLLLLSGIALSEMMGREKGLWGMRLRLLDGWENVSTKLMDGWMGRWDGRVRGEGSDNMTKWMCLVGWSGHDLASNVLLLSGSRRQSFTINNSVGAVCCCLLLISHSVSCQSGLPACFTFIMLPHETLLIEAGWQTWLVVSVGWLVGWSFVCLVYCWTTVMISIVAQPNERRRLVCFNLVLFESRKSIQAADNCCWPASVIPFHSIHLISSQPHSRHFLFASLTSCCCCSEHWSQLPRPAIQLASLRWSEIRKMENIGENVPLQ